MVPKTVRAPAAMEPVFEAAENTVAKYFAGFDADPSKGTIEISGERYVLIRAAALSVEFFSLAERLFGEGRQSDAQEFARSLLFDLAHAIGESDALSFQERMQLKREVNEMARRAGVAPPYDLAFAEAGKPDGDKGVATQ